MFKVFAVIVTTALLCGKLFAGGCPPVARLAAGPGGCATHAAAYQPVQPLGADLLPDVPPDPSPAPPQCQQAAAAYRLPAFAQPNPVAASYYGSRSAALLPHDPGFAGYVPRRVGFADPAIAYNRGLAGFNQLGYGVGPVRSFTRFRPAAVNVRVRAPFVDVRVARGFAPVHTVSAVLPVAGQTTVIKHVERRGLLGLRRSSSTTIIQR